MRVFAIAMIAACGLAAAAPASARVWNDPAGRVTFDAPNSWLVTFEESSEYSWAVAGTASNECHIIAMPREGTVNAKIADVVRTATTPFTPEQWVALANNVTPVFRDQAVLNTQSVETEGRFWPLQRAELTGPTGAVHGSVQLRPGMELWAYCLTYDGADPVARYDAVIRSVATPHDVALQARGETEAAEAAAAAAAPPPPAEDPEAPARRRNTRDWGSGDNE